MSEIKLYRDLEIWKRSKALAVRIYKSTENFPNSEIYGLTSQIRRAAVSIPSNIAEGSRRISIKEKSRFPKTSFGSGAELETQLEIALDLDYLKKDVYESLAGELEEIMKMLNVTIRRLSTAEDDS